MLSFGQGDLIVTLCHWWKDQIQIYSPSSGKVCWEDTLKTSEEHDDKWSRTLKTSASLITARPGNCNSTQNPSKKSSQKQKSNRKASYHRPEPFMGRGSLCVATPPWRCKITFGTLAVSLLLLSAMITTGSPTPVIGEHSNTETDSDRFGTEDPKSFDMFDEENVELSIKSAASPLYENATSRGRGADRLPDNVLFRAERSPSGKTKKKKPGSGENGRSRNCSRHSMTLNVRELGLGYNSDEYVTLYYCVGTCQPSTNYDKALTNLLNKQRIPQSPHRAVSSQPCCRPTHLVSVTFMNVEHEYQEIKKMSAAGCICGG
ncbi:Persephin-like [Pristimantis euphronides]